MKNWQNDIYVTAGASPEGKTFQIPLHFKIPDFVRNKDKYNRFNHIIVIT
jgi:hypothetical protein